MFDKFQKEARIAAACLSLAGVSFGASGCGRAPNETSASVGRPQQTPAARISNVVDAGNGVYVFPTRDFAFTLSDFRGAHPELRVVAVTQGEDQREQYMGEYHASWGRAQHFVVVTESAFAGPAEAAPLPRLGK